MTTTVTDAPRAVIGTYLTDGSGECLRRLRLCPDVVAPTADSCGSSADRADVALPQVRHEVNAFEGFKRETFCRSRRDVDQDRRLAQPLVLLRVDVERCPAELAQSKVMGADRKLTV